MDNIHPNDIGQFRDQLTNLLTVAESRGDQYLVVVRTIFSQWERHLTTGEIFNVKTPSSAA